MDVWRYSDWWGLGAELRNSQRHIWHWRDWIVEAHNKDKGYDQMLREMLAADELYPTDADALRGTGFRARHYFLFNRTTGPLGNAGTVGVRSAGSPLGLIDPISGPGGTLEYDHQDGISITGGFVYRGTLIPELVGKYVFGDLALRVSGGVRIDGRLFYADLITGVIEEFLLAFPNGVLPNGQTVHGFGEDANGELYVLATNSPSSGTGGVMYAIQQVPEPSTVISLVIAAASLLSLRRHRLRTDRKWEQEGHRTN